MGLLFAPSKVSFLCCEAFAVGPIRTADPPLRQTMPVGLISPVKRQLGNGLAIGGKLQELLKLLPRSLPVREPIVAHGEVNTCLPTPWSGDRSIHTTTPRPPQIGAPLDDVIVPVIPRGNFWWFDGGWCGAGAPASYQLPPYEVKLPRGDGVILRDQCRIGPSMCVRARPPSDPDRKATRLRFAVPIHSGHFLLNVF